MNLYSLTRGGKNMAEELNSPSTSLGVWMEGEKDYFTYQLHVNIWITGEAKERYLELGIKIPEVEGLQSVNIYVPYIINDEHFQELGESLSNNPKILSALFNKSVTIRNNHGTPSNFRAADIEGIGEIKICTISDSLRKIEKKGSGSIIKIDFDSCCPKKEDQKGAFYFRFRLNNLQALHSQQNGPHFWFSGKEEKFSFLDFKLNNFRTLPNDIGSYVAKDYLQEIHLFLLTCTNISITLNTRDPNDIRLIEDSLWSDYLYNQRNNKRCEGEIVAFHWMENNEHEEKPVDPATYRYELFAKLSSESNNWRFIGLAFVITLVLAISSSVLSSFIYSYLTTQPKSENLEEAKTTDNDDIDHVQKSEKVPTTLPPSSGNK